ncbi:Bor family protein [Stigmatella hybrida]|uniref:Bor family protein n=1 Tax=Stigmatella hybrida TaxID=394097 RepID=UPI001CDAE3D6|nr:Bor family protein [Stigmatella hybrida]
MQTPVSRKNRRVVATALFLSLNAGCYHYGVQVPAPAPATEPQRKTVHSLAWGLLNKPQDVTAITCKPSNALDEVRVTTHFGYTVLTALTLGFWSPLRVEWRCAKRPEEEGVIGLQVPALQEAPHE